METTLKIIDNDMDDEDLQNLTRELSQTLIKNTDVQPTLVEGAAEPGTRGDPLTLGTILISVLTHGSVLLLFEVLKYYFERKPTLEMEFRRPDGKTLVIRAGKIGTAQIDHTIQSARKFWGL